MIRIIMMLVALVALSSCEKAPESTTAAGVEFQVDRLFTHDGCTVYRFEDGRISQILCSL